MFAQKRFIILSAFVILVMVLSACQAATPAPPALGTAENPIIMGMAPSATSQELQAGGESVAKKLSEMTGYTIKVTVPNSYAALVEAMGSGNAHIGWLPPLAYMLAKQKGAAEVGLAAIRFGSDHYGTQFIANVESGFTPYFDQEKNENTADAPTALAQLTDKKPCWADPLSASGYVIPYGFFTKNNIKLGEAVYTGGHTQTVSAIYAGGTCDFGATFIDARTASQFKDVKDMMEKVVVIWRTDPVIPNDNVSYATSLPVDMREKITDALVELSGTEDGRALLKTGGYEVESLKVVDDTFYDDFRVYLQSTGLDITKLVK
jgi:phosphonate transport system substrate-binding protein